MSKKVKYSLVAAVLAAGVATSANAAGAADSLNDTHAAVRVSLQGFRPGDPVSAQTLLQRIRDAAAEACGPDPAHWTIYLGPEYRACVADSVDRAVASLHSPLITTLNARQQGRPTVIAAAGER
jgi:UrcA family protein